MRRLLLTVGFVLLAGSLAMFMFSGSGADEHNTNQEIDYLKSVSASQRPMLNAGVSSMRHIPWKKHLVTVDGKAIEVLFKEYPSPVSYKEVYESMGSEDRTQSTAVGTMFLHLDMGCKFGSEEDLVAFSKLYSSPKEFMDRYGPGGKFRQKKWIGDFDKIRARFHRQGGNLRATGRIAGEMIINDCFCFIVNFSPMPRPLLLYESYVKKGDMYYSLNDDESRPEVSGVLRNDRYLHLFKNPKYLNAQKEAMAAWEEGREPVFEK